METVQSRTLHGESVDTDDKTFIDCTFSECILTYSGAPVAFHRTRFHGCRYIFFGSALRTVHFLQGSGLMPFDPEHWTNVSEEVH